MIEKVPSVVRPPPTYMVKYPININIDNNIVDIHRQLKQQKEQMKPRIQNQCKVDFFTDGSCIPNPGPGGAAYFSPTFAITSKIKMIDHDTTINYCELCGIKMVLNSVNRYISFCEKQGMILNWNYINIYTDSSFVCDVMTKYDYY